MNQGPIRTARWGEVGPKLTRAQKGRPRNMCQQCWTEHKRGKCTKNVRLGHGNTTPCVCPCEKS